MQYFFLRSVHFPGSNTQHDPSVCCFPSLSTGTQWGPVGPRGSFTLLISNPQLPACSMLSSWLLSPFSLSLSRLPYLCCSPLFPCMDFRCLCSFYINPFITVFCDSTQLLPHAICNKCYLNQIASHTLVTALSKS